MTSILRTAAITALLAGAISAQRPFAAGGGTPPDPAARIADQITRLTTLLDLSTGQAAQATGILTAAQTSMAALQTTQSTDQTSLQAAITSNATGTIDQLSAAIGTINGQMLDIRSKAAASFYAILTPAQQAKVTTLGGAGILGGGGPGGPGGGRGGPGGPGPRP